jgi:hypothetical protein
VLLLTNLRDNHFEGGGCHGWIQNSECPLPQGFFTKLRGGFEHLDDEPDCREFATNKLEQFQDVRIFRMH